MRLSPFESPSDDDWLCDAPLYGGYNEYPHPNDPYEFEVIPVRSDDESPPEGYQRIHRKAEEYEKQPIDFDIENAHSGKEYMLCYDTGDPPQLLWYSREGYKRRHLHDPMDYPKPRGVTEDGWQDYLESWVTGEPKRRIHLNENRCALLRRIVRLWNGEVVRGVHLLADGCPSITELTGDLNEDDLKELYYDTDVRNVLLAFGDADWFTTTDGLLRSTSLFRKTVWYDLTPKGRKKIYRAAELPNLRGDPFEGLVHRVTVGLTRLRDELRGWDGASYYELDDYVVDVITQDPHGQARVYEVMTDHNNWELYRDTYQKLQQLDDDGIETHAVFDSRQTAYKVFNYWHRQGLSELPNGTFDSVYSVSNGREQIQKAYQNDAYHWPVADWTTTWKLKGATLDSNDFDVSRDQVISVNW